MSRDPSKPEAVSLEERLGHVFDDRSLLDTALTHRSFAHEESGRARVHYERLEFLGDALLGFLVAEWLWQDDPAAMEGSLTRRMQGVVRRPTLAAAARRLGLGSELRLGRGEEVTGGRRKQSLLADVFEAVLGAVYFDGGLEAARRFVVRHLRQALEEARGLPELADDYKTQFQERVQGRLRVTPRYRIVDTRGPAHALRFEAEVLVEGRVRGRGRGSSRKEAEQQAAREALRGVVAAEAANDEETE